MKKNIIYILAAAACVACGGKKTSGNAEQTTEPAVEQAVEQTEETVEPLAEAEGKFTYTMDKDVAMEVFKLLGSEAVVDASLLALDVCDAYVEQQNESGRGVEMYDYIDDSWVECPEDVCFGVKVVCLKKKDGKYIVAFHNTSAFEGSIGLLKTRWLEYDGQKISKVESIVPQVRLTDELDEWIFAKYGATDDMADLKDPKNVMLTLRVNEDNSRSVVVKQLGIFGGRVFDWDGKKLVETDEAVLKNYALFDDGSIPGFEFESALPDFPKMEHYELVRNGDTDATLNKDGKGIIKFGLTDGKVTSRTILSEEYGLAVGVETYQDVY